jgi:hypothetical protein
MNSIISLKRKQPVAFSYDDNKETSAERNLMSLQTPAKKFSPNFRLKNANPKSSVFIESWAPVMKIEGTVQWNLSDMLATVRNFIAKNKTEGAADDASIGIALTYADNRPNEFRLIKTPNFDRYYSDTSFNKLFTEAFKKKLAEALPTSVDNMPKMLVKINDNVTQATADKSVFTHLDYLYFRPLTCLLFNILFHITLSCCACYPKNISERIAHQSGIAKNCYSVECENYLRQNPEAYDSLYVGNCGNAATAIAINYLKILALKSLQININISQIIEKQIESNRSS